MICLSQNAYVQCKDTAERKAYECGKCDLCTQYVRKE